jgi:hypothetical protein
MQRDGNNMAHVFLCYLNLYRHITQFSDNATMDPLKERLENRWQKEEHHLFFLAFALHPAFRNIAVKFLSASTNAYCTFTINKNVLTVARFKKAAVFYMEKFNLWTTADNHKTESRQLGKNLAAWLMEDGEFNQVELPPGKFKGTDDAAGYWLQHTVEHPGIANLAVHLLCCPVQSAACERLFKDYPLFHTKLRNQLKTEKYHKMTQIKHGLQRRRTAAAGTVEGKKKQKN